MKVGVTPQSPRLSPLDVADGKEFTLRWGAVQPGQQKGRSDRGRVGMREMKRDERRERERLRLKQRPRETERQRRKGRKTNRNRDGERYKEKVT